MAALIQRLLSRFPKTSHSSPEVEESHDRKLMSGTKDEFIKSTSLSGLFCSHNTPEITLEGRQVNKF